MAPPARPDFTWTSPQIDAASLDGDPQQQLQAHIFEGTLTVTVKGETLATTQLPDDAFTDGASARVQHGRLAVTIPRRDPQGPAMQEKRLLDPDTHPVPLTIALSPELAAQAAEHHKTLTSPAQQPGGKTPAQLTTSEFNPDMYGEPSSAHYQMPEVNMGSSVVSSMPILSAPGGAVSTVSQGESVVMVPGVTGARHLADKGQAGGGGGGQQEMPSTPEALADKLRDATVRDEVAQGAPTVLFGQRERETEAAYDDSAVSPARGLAASGGGGQQQQQQAGVADAPAGDDDDGAAAKARQLATGAKGDRVRADFTASKVGMEFEERTAADRYVTSDSRDNEPISSLKQPGPKCDLCECNPCVCHMMRKTGGTGNDPFELTPAETKRGGAPAIHASSRRQTGVNAHEARDYRGHTMQADPAHGVGRRMAEFQGDVPDGAGDWSDPKYAGTAGSKAHTSASHGATHTGGSPIELGGPGKRHMSEGVGGGPSAGGHKTNIQTMG